MRDASSDCLPALTRYELARKKALPTEQAFELILRLLDQTNGSVVVLDFDRRAPMVGDVRCKGIKPGWGHISVDRLCALYELSDLIIGIDSGPFHVAALTDIKSLGIFYGLHATRVCLPNPNATYLVPEICRRELESRPDVWKFEFFGGGMPDVTCIASMAERILDCSKNELQRAHLYNRCTGANSSIHSADTRIVGRYLYRRFGHDERPMTLAENGNIVEGDGAAERRWVQVEQNFCILGDYGIIAVLSCDNRGVWCGRWTQFEQMKIELVPTWKPLSRGNGFAWYVDPTIEWCDADLRDHEDWMYEHFAVPQGGLFVDVGAFVGVHSIRVAKLHCCRVIAIEPVQEHANMISRNPQLNGVEKSITVVQCCAGGRECEVVMSLRNEQPR